ELCAVSGVWCRRAKSQERAEDGAEWGNRGWAEEFRRNSHEDKMTPSLCERCQRMREVVSSKGSRFLICEYSQSDPQYQKYPPQPVLRCEAFESCAVQPNDDPGQK